MKTGFVSRLTLAALLLCMLSACARDGAGNEAGPYAWRSSTPAEQDMEPGLLQAAFAQAQASGFVDSLLVIRHGFIVAEGYFNGFAATRPHDVRSVSKSFLSAMVGIALQQGHIGSLDEKMLDYFPEYVSASLDPRKREITLRHLLTMRMGIRGEGEDNYGVYWGLYYSNNWVKATIEAPLAYAPGERMRYNTFATHLLSAILTKATKRSTLDFATEELCVPMGIDIDAWEQDPQAIYFGGNAMQFTPREMAVLGYTYLNGGRLDGEQIVPEAYVDYSLSPSTKLTHPNAWGFLKNYNYAGLWWLGQVGGRDMFLAFGYGGQFIAVFPGIDLLVVSTAPWQVEPARAEEQEQAILGIMATTIVPAAGE